MAGPMSRLALHVACLLTSFRKPITRLHVAGCHPGWPADLQARPNVPNQVPGRQGHAGSTDLLGGRCLNQDFQD